MKFVHPDLFFLFIFIPLLIGIYLYSLWIKKRNIAKYGQIALVKQLMPLASKFRSITKFVLISLALSLFIFALLRPQLGAKLGKVEKEGVEIILALDVSNSMLADDITPSRLEKAKLSISKMIDKLENDKIGLIAFAGDAFTQIPLTPDFQGAKIFLPSINPSIINKQGTAVGEAIKIARKSFSGDESSSKVIIVISDGENHEDDAVKEAKEAREKGIVVHTIGMGTPEGHPIPLRAGLSGSDYKRDKEGSVIVSKLNESLLMEIASVGNGTYVRATNSETGLNIILKEIDKLKKTKFDTEIYSEYEEQFQIFVAIGLFLLLLEFYIFERKNPFFSKFNLFKLKI